MRWAILLSVLVIIAGLGFARPVRALSCIPISDIIAKMDVIVRAKITAIPTEGSMDLAVSQYLKGGNGAPTLRAQVAGIGRGQRMDWYAEPKVGDELIVGFVQQGDALENQACHLFVQPGHESPLPPEVQQLLSQPPPPDLVQPADPPAPPERPPSPPRGYLLPVVGVLGLGIVALAACYLRRR